ncbi:MAG: UPF0175 family protein [Fimbriimonadales bacterium]|nr:UPF0175 family protein [Fimbriimonadales bacterium]
MNKVAPAWLEEQFLRLSHRRPELVARILERAFSEDDDFRWAVVVDAYLDEQISLGKAAELLGVHRAALQRRFVEMGIPVRIGAETIEEAQAEVESLRRWRTPQESR